jgi:hypothetical protein
MKTTIALLLIFSSLLVFGETEHQKAYRLYNRLCSVPPTRSELTRIKLLINTDGEFKAAMNIIDSCHGFYNITVPALVKPWTNAGRFNRVALNDMVATIVGFTREAKTNDTDTEYMKFNEIL